MSSRIEQIIDEIEEYIDSCKFQPLSTTKIIVNKDQIDELRREGLMDAKAGYIYLTERGQDISNYCMAKFLLD